MVKVISKQSQALAAVTGSMGYYDAKKQITNFCQKHRLTIADMPTVIGSMATHSDVYKSLSSKSIFTVTGEYHGFRDDFTSCYEVWHSVGSLVTVENPRDLSTRWTYIDFVQISHDEWNSVGNANYNGRSFERVHLSDARKGNVPATGTPYVIFTSTGDREFSFNRSGRLSYDSFMQDDRVLMVAGSPDAREALAKKFFGKKEDGGEGWNTFGSYHNIEVNEFGHQALGRPLYLNTNSNCGFFWCSSMVSEWAYDKGCFLALAHDAERTKKPFSAGTLQSTLERT
jgi:hypothetical protein